MEVATAILLTQNAQDNLQRLGIPVPDLLRRVLLRSKRKVERRVDEAVGGDDDAP